jgi:phosphatidylserine/phosphatidylglycerophosphate/cardiolipin synthase-like enzyme
MHNMTSQGCDMFRFVYDADRLKNSPARGTGTGAERRRSADPRQQGAEFSAMRMKTIRRWMEAIQQAREKIFFESYIIHEDQEGWAFADLLAAKAREGGAGQTAL